MHAATEQHLAQAGTPFTALRNGFYASTLGWYVGDAMTTGRFALPADGPVSWTAHDDLADAAVAALTTDGLLDGVTAPLTAPEALDLADVAAMLGEAHRPPLRAGRGRRRRVGRGRRRRGDARARRGVHARHVPRLAPGRVRRHRPDAGAGDRPPGDARRHRARGAAGRPPGQVAAGVTRRRTGAGTAGRTGSAGSSRAPGR
nr:hypothetical protein [Angustibacter aerolatus]